MNVKKRREKKRTPTAEFAPNEIRADGKVYARKREIQGGGIDSRINVKRPCNDIN